jgi:hypothetical protein
MTRTAAQLICDERNTTESARGATWVPRETSPGTWEPVLVRLPLRPKVPDDALSRSEPPPPRSLPREPPIEPDPPSRVGRAVGRAIGRSLDLIGFAIVGVLVACPVLAFVWVAYRLVGFDSGEELRRIAIGVSALSAVSGVLQIGEIRMNLRSIRNAPKPRELTWRQFDVNQRVFLRVGQLSVVVGLAGIAVAIPGQLY